MDFNKLIKENAITLMLFVLLFNYGFIHFCVIPGHTAAAALQDYGTIQVLTALLIVSAQILSIWNFTQTNETKTKIGAFALVVVLQIYFMREADLHKFWTGKSIAGIRYFKDFDLPLLPKIIAGPILLLFLACFAYILIRYSIFAIKAFFRGEPWAIALGFWGVIFLTSQWYDRIHWEDYEWTTEDGKVPWRIKLIEEYMEFLAAAYLPTAMILYIRMKNASLPSGKPACTASPSDIKK
jgi:hypothetical protein